MSKKSALVLLFCCILLSMLLVTGWASTQQSVLQWRGLEGPQRGWTIATLMDAYCGFVTFYVWVLYKEARWLPRLAWFVGIMLLGNMAMSAYVLLQVSRLPRGQGASAFLTARNR
jgi:hypothetical protein